IYEPEPAPRKEQDPLPSRKILSGNTQSVIDYRSHSLEAPPMAKKTLVPNAAKNIVFSALKGMVSTKIRELHVTLEAVLPKKSQQGAFADRLVDLVNARNYFLPRKFATFSASMRIKDIIGTITSALPGMPTTPEPGKPVPTIPSRRKSPSKSPRKEKKARST